MQIKLVGSLTYVLSYGLLLVTVVTFIASLYVMALALLLPWTFRGVSPERRISLGVKSKGMIVVMVCASSAVLFFLVKNMFFEFRAITVRKDVVEIEYFWPRPHHAISRSQFERFELETDYKGFSQLYLFADGTKYTSTAFDRTVDRQALKGELQGFGDGKITP